MKLRREYHFDERVSTCVADRPPNIGAMFRRAVAEHPAAIAIVDDAQELSYAELADRVDRLGAALRAAGIVKGDRVATLLPNCTAALEINLACAELGAIQVLMSTRQRAPETEYMLNDSGATMLIWDMDCALEIPAADRTPSLVSSLVHGGSIAGILSYDDLLDTCGVAPTAEVDEEDAACILYTSGTTGRPKGAVLTHFGIIHSCIALREALSLRAGDCTVLAAPISHVTGLVVVSLPMFLVGGRIAILRDFKVARFLEKAETHGMSFTVLVPAMYNLLLLDGSFADRDLCSWRVAGFGGAPMPEATIIGMNSALPDLQLASIYGSTETTGPAVIMPPEFGVSRRDAVGKALPFCDIRVMDDDGYEVATGESGEVWIAGPNVVPRYWANPQASFDGLPGGYWRSGDLGVLDERGFLQILDRKKDMLNRGGFKIYSAEVENLISHMAGVEEVAIVGRPCPVLGERVHAFVRNSDGTLTTEAVRVFCATRLSDYKVPEFVTFTTEPLPRNANGKLLKQDLRRLAQEQAM